MPVSIVDVDSTAVSQTSPESTPALTVEAGDLILGIIGHTAAGQDLTDFDIDGATPTFLNGTLPGDPTDTPAAMSQDEQGRLFLAYAVAPDADPVAITGTWNVVPRHAMAALAFRGADVGGTPITWVANSTTDASITGTEILVSGINAPADSIVVLACWYRGLSGATFTPDSGTTEQVERNTASGGAHCLVVATKPGTGSPIDIGGDLPGVATPDDVCYAVLIVNPAGGGGSAVALLNALINEG